ncbi:MAG: hypothetical protein QE267_10705 [Akkermansiaceae bacterium]|nr:hypothetical protein [Akkermansiaceae bacterium]
MFSCVKDFVVVQSFAGDACGPVGEARKCHHGKPERARLDGFQHGAHADGIGAERVEHPDFCWGLILRPAQASVDALVKGNS